MRGSGSSLVADASEVPADLGAIANRACAADPDMRFPNARAFREALEGFLSLRETHALVQSAEALLESSDPQDPRPFYQAQFVLEQALRARPGLPSAKRALTRCRGLMFDQALRELPASSPFRLEPLEAGMMMAAAGQAGIAGARGGL